MAPPAKSPVSGQPPATLPADFFDKQGAAPATLPANFFGSSTSAAPPRLGSLTAAPPQTALGYLHDVENDLRHGGNRTIVGRVLGDLQGRGDKGYTGLEYGTSPGVANYMGSIPLGLVKSAEGVGEASTGHPLTGLKDFGLGALQTYTLPLTVAAGPATEATGDAAAAGASALREMPSQLHDILRPTPSPDIVPSGEMAARRLAQVVLPASKDATPFIQAAPEEVPNVLDYARRTNNPLKTQLEFSKAAEGSAKEARDFYEDQILGPSANKVVRTTGSGFGERTGESPDTYASLRDIDRRVVDINKQLDKPALNADDARRALATKTELQAEASRLRQILHQSLSDSTGLTPEQIGQVRQRVGRGYELANDTNAAVTQRMQSGGRAEQAPLHWTQLPSRLTEFIRGGPQAIADRQFQRVIQTFPGEATPLPELRPIVQEPSTHVDELIRQIRAGRAK